MYGEIIVRGFHVFMRTVEEFWFHVQIRVAQPTCFIGGIPTQYLCNVCLYYLHFVRWLVHHRRLTFSPRLFLQCLANHAFGDCFF
ncbi:wsv169 [White spot syndrome virus]|uniref:Wsv169 n=4 Tax=White spot syndrome virus TaxID=342409 RepID=Q8VB30_WSSVS|nr:wsv169 [Shrimp white spot syndrome virus]AFX59547.1 wsv169 [White spot syndrome virus]AAL33173.1 wsv169 [Shrimp white spot syndrome virus]AAL89093.1 WSSV225 [Shrimp white spot syndrome virus]AWQ60347.1 wsv169 [Shrimp white spot syndrome virus]AWQ60760.1 wsv169 [Shrimp white spot syndrome virus]